MKLPPSPPNPPLVQMLQWIVRPMALMEDCAKRYGDLFTLMLGENAAPIVFTSNPQALQEILSDYTHFDAPAKFNKIFQP